MYNYTINFSIDEIEYMRNLISATKRCKMQRNTIDDSLLLKSIEIKLKNLVIDEE